jgi:hypothetical protein
MKMFAARNTPIEAQSQPARLTKPEEAPVPFSFPQGLDHAAIRARCSAP